MSAPHSSRPHGIHIAFPRLTDKEDSNRQSPLHLGCDPPFLCEIRNGIARKRAAHGRVDHRHHTRENDKSLLALHSLLVHMLS